MVLLLIMPNVESFRTISNRALQRRRERMETNFPCRPATYLLDQSRDTGSSTTHHKKDELNASKDEEMTEKNRKGVSLEEMDWETAQIEQRQAQKTWFKLMAPYEISRYVTTALWVFVAVGYLLNFMGYAYVWKDGLLTVDTLAQREFQDELARGLREASRHGPQ